MSINELPATQAVEVVCVIGADAAAQPQPHALPAPQEMAA
jgi:hypothetical protein